MQLLEGSQGLSGKGASRQQALLSRQALLATHGLKPVAEVQGAQQAGSDMHAALCCCMSLQLPSDCSIQPSCKPHLRLCAACSQRLLLLQAQVVGRRLTACRMKQHNSGKVRDWALLDVAP